MNAWSRLPNAKHVDWVMAHSEKHPEFWCACALFGPFDEWPVSKSRQAIIQARKEIVWPSGRDEIFRNARRIVYNIQKKKGAEIFNSIYGTVCYTLVGLIAFDEVDYVLNASADAVALYAALGVPQAILLQTMHKIQALDNKPAMCYNML